MRTVGRLVAVLGLVGCFALMRGEAADPKDKPKFKMSADEEKLVELTNAERKEHKLPPLKPNALLFAAARAHSQNQARQQKMSHILDGKGPKERIQAVGYKHSWYGENVASASGNRAVLTKVMQSWMDSKGHRENILKKTYTEIGIGIAKDSRGTYYYTQVFAAPKR
jgi:uncharacterized protein YkwD